MKYLHRPTVWVFLILLGSYGYFWHSRDWNSASRLMLTYAMIDHGTISIDGLEDQTHDIAFYQGHNYTDKTPGFSLLAIPPSWLAKRFFRLPDHPLRAKGFAHWWLDYWATLGTSGLATALAGVVLAGLARDLGCGPRRSALVGLAYGLCTPAFAYATMAYGHQVAAAMLLGSFALLWRDRGQPRLRAAFAGFLASYASVVEIQVGPASAILGLYALALAIGRKRPGSSVLTFALGAAVPASILLVYNNQAFGSPWRMGYFYLVTERFKDIHSATNPLGLARPDWSRVGELLGGQRRGLVWYAPIVLLTVPGLAVLAVRKLWGMLIVPGLIMIAVFLVNLSYPEWTGGWTTGPRLLVPLLPFALLPVAALLARGWRGVTALAILLALAGGVVILLFQGVGARVPDQFLRPLVENVWPLWRGVRPLPGWVFGQRYARNWLGLTQPNLVEGLPYWARWLQFLPLVIGQLVGIGLMARLVQNEPPEEHPSAKEALEQIRGRGNRRRNRKTDKNA